MQQTVYFIPGTMCDERLWQQSWQRLRSDQRFEVKLIHLTIPVIEPMLDVVDYLADKINTPNAILVGFSLGGYIAAALALRYPEKFSHLVIVSNLPKNLPEQEVKQRKRTISWVKQRGYSGIPTKRIYDLLHPDIKTFSDIDHNEIEHTISNMDSSLGEKVLLQQLSVSMHRRSLVDKLPSLPIPVSFLVGDADVLVDMNELHQRTEFAKNISITSVDNTGHMLPLENPKALSSLLGDILINNKAL